MSTPHPDQEEAPTMRRPFLCPQRDREEAGATPIQGRLDGALGDGGSGRAVVVTVVVCVWAQSGFVQCA